MYVIGLDVGTTGAKAVVFDLSGNVKGYGFKEYGVVCEKADCAEQDAEKVWEHTKRVIIEAIEQSGTKEIAALSLSVQGDAVIPVDNNICALHNALLGMDYRTKKESIFCGETFGDRELFEITGMRPHPMNSLTKILWFKNNCPEIYRKTYKFMTYADFILAKLGAEPVIDYTMASRTMAFDLQKKKWSDRILNKLEINIDLLSKPVPSGCIIGQMDETLAKELGLCSKVKLVSGGHDQTCAALGAGIIEEDIALDSHGTAEVVSTAFKSIRTNDTMYSGYYPCYCHVVKDQYFTFSLNHIGGLLLKWFRDNFGYEDIKKAEDSGGSAYQIMIENAPQEPSSVMVLPHLNGSGTPWCDLNSKGAFVGLTMSTTKYDIVKAILDSLAYELRINIETMREAGIKINELRCVGGAARNEKWLQIKADVTGCVVKTLKVREAACLGAAILAACAAGGYTSVQDAVAKTVKIHKTYIPDINLVENFDEKYNVYKKLYYALKPINNSI